MVSKSGHFLDNFWTFFDPLCGLFLDNFLELLLVQFFPDFILFLNFKIISSAESRYRSWIWYCFRNILVCLIQISTSVQKNLKRYPKHIPQNVKKWTPKSNKKVSRKWTKMRVAKSIKIWRLFPPNHLESVNKNSFYSIQGDHR